MLVELMKRYSLRKMEGLKDWQVELAIRSHVFYMLLIRCDGPVDQLISLRELHEAAGSPEGLEPAAHRAEYGETTSTRGAVFEDRGEQGLFADYETAAWYAQRLDDRIGPDHIIETFY